MEVFTIEERKTALAKVCELDKRRSDILKQICDLRDEVDKLREHETELDDKRISLMEAYDIVLMHFSDKSPEYQLKEKEEN